MKKERGRQILCMIVAAFFGLLANTIGFFSFLELARKIAHVKMQGVFYLIYISLVKNIIPEYSISMAAVAFVVLGVRRGLKLGIDGNNLKRAKAAEAAEKVAEPSGVEVTNVEQTSDECGDIEAETKEENENGGEQL